VKTKLVALMLVCAACGSPPPPRTITVSEDLPLQVQAAAYIARDAWCASPVGWCPEIVTGFADAQIIVHRFTGNNPGAKLHNDGARIEVQPDAVDFDLSGAMTHEFGHFGIDGHVEDSELMHKEFASSLDIPVTVDPEAVGAWCKEQECDQ
jgi:hypothetical protein